MAQQAALFGRSGTCSIECPSCLRVSSTAYATSLAGTDLSRTPHVVGKAYGAAQSQIWQTEADESRLWEISVGC